jgi:hypothetical protein
MGDAMKCRICGVAFEEPDPEKRAMRMKHHLGNHHASGRHPELAAFAPPYLSAEATDDRRYDEAATRDLARSLLDEATDDQEGP